MLLGEKHRWRLRTLPEALSLPGRQMPPLLLEREASEGGTAAACNGTSSS